VASCAVAGNYPHSDYLPNDDILNFAIEFGNLDRTEVLERFEMKKREQFLQEHNIKIYSCKNGTFSACYYEGGKRKTVRRAKKKDVEDFMIALIEQQETNPTIADLFAVVCEKKLQNDGRKQSTILRNQREFKRAFSDFGKRRIRDIDPVDVENILISVKRDFDMTATEYSNILGILRSILFLAEHERYISFDYENAIKRAGYINDQFRSTKKDDSEEIYSTDEVEIICDYIWRNPTIHRLGILLMFYTGIRAGELSSLRWDDVDRTDPEYVFLRIDEGETEVKVDGHRTTNVSTPKTNYSIRSIPIPRQAVPIFDLAKKFNPDSDFIFAYKGNRIKAEKFRKNFMKTCKYAGIKYKSCHKIRKTYATRMSENSVSDHLLMELMGHSSIQTTRNNYIKRRTVDAEKADAVDAVFS